MKVLGVIPARYASTRFPGKPLIRIGSRTMIECVWRQVSQCKDLATVIIATDDERIFQEVKRFGGMVEMTASHHPSGTDRIGEIAQRHSDFDVIVNIQGDEPMIAPEQISLVLEPFFQQENTQISTLVQPFQTTAEIENPNYPKVVLRNDGTALYFSRSVIPYPRAANGNPKNLLEKIPYWKHIGIYAWRNVILQQIVSLPPSTLEQAESLEQLRWLENGYTIHTRITHQKTWSIDTPEDWENLKRNFNLKD